MSSRLPCFILIFALGCGGEGGEVPLAGEGAGEISNNLLVGTDAVVTGTGGGLNLRSGPSTSNAILHVMPEGATVKVVGGETAGFYLVVHAGQTGYAWGGYLAPAPLPPLADRLAVGTDAVVSGAVGLNLRSGPGTWNPVLGVMPEGARVRIEGGAVNGFYAVRYAGLAGFAYGAYLEPAPARVSLQALVDSIAAERAWHSPGTDVSIAVRNLSTGEYASHQGDALHVSASSAKVVWVAAALGGVGIEQVAPYAEAIFQTSDNHAAGSVIDLIGPDAVNTFYWAAGMSRSALSSWSYGGSRVAANSPRAMGGLENYFTANDAVTFLTRLDRGELLGPSETSQLLSWLKLTPRSGFGGWLGTRLPPDARASLRHKAGWLPPGCCGDDASFNTLNEVGIVQVQGGERYAVAILARHGIDYWTSQVAYVERASWRIYQAVAGAP